MTGWLVFDTHGVTFRVVFFRFFSFLFPFSFRAVYRFAFTAAYQGIWLGRCAIHREIQEDLTDASPTTAEGEVLVFGF